MEFTIKDRLNLYAGRMMYPMTERNSRLRQARAIAAMTGLIMITAIDTTDSTFDACLYSIDGAAGSSVIEVAQSLEIYQDGLQNMANGDCIPHVES